MGTRSTAPRAKPRSRRENLIKKTLRLCVSARTLLLLITPLTVTAAPIWQEAKIGALPYVTFDSFCEFYEFNKPAPADQDTLAVSGVYGQLTLKANSREAWLDGRRVWLSFPFVRDEHGNTFVSRLDVIKLFDPLLRRHEAAPRQRVLGVVIDAGHGGTDNGTRSHANYFEKIAALDTARRLEAVLKAGGIPAFMTRGDDVFIPLPERSTLANQRPGWLFVSLHYNEGGPNASGVETFCLSPRYSPSTSDGGNLKLSDREQQPGNKNDPLNIILADTIHAELIRLHPDSDRGVKRARFLVLKNTDLPAVLVEGGFLSNSGDAKLITTGAYRQQLAEAVARGVKNYIALMNSAPARAPVVIKPAPAPDQPQFRQPVAPPVRVPVVPNLNEITREVPDDQAPPAPAAPPLEEIVPEPDPNAPADPEAPEPEHGHDDDTPPEPPPSAPEPPAPAEPPPSAPEQPEQKPNEHATAQQILNLKS